MDIFNNISIESKFCLTTKKIAVNYVATIRHEYGGPKSYPECVSVIYRHLLAATSAFCRVEEFRKTDMLQGFKSAYICQIGTAVPDLLCEARK